MGTNLGMSYINIEYLSWYWQNTDSSFIYLFWTILEKQFKSNVRIYSWVYFCSRDAKRPPNRWSFLMSYATVRVFSAPYARVSSPQSLTRLPLQLKTWWRRWTLPTALTPDILLRMRTIVFRRQLAKQLMWKWQQNSLLVGRIFYIHTRV